MFGWILLVALACKKDEPLPVDTDPSPTGSTCPDGCPSEEICDGIDNDLNGQIDEGDSDGDGVFDCFDPEDCDLVDNDGDGEIDEGFPLTDTDGDGVIDCADEEECDGADNDGDGLVDEGFDSDEDGLTDCNDVEECDGLDNNGDTEVDEGSPDIDEDGIADCVDVEDCDHEDNNGDGLIDEDWPDVDADGLADCVDTCRLGPETASCTVSFPGSTPVLTCDAGFNPSFTSNSAGWISIDIDLENWDTLIVDADLLDATGYSVDLGNSDTCDGDGGDQVTSFWNEEFQLYDNDISLYANELSSNLRLVNQLDAVAAEDSLHIEVCDNIIRWNTSLVDDVEASEHVFELSGDELDLVLYPVDYADEKLHLGFNHVPKTGSPKAGSGVISASFTVARGSAPE